MNSILIDEFQWFSHFFLLSGCTPKIAGSRELKGFCHSWQHFTPRQKGIRLISTPPQPLIYIINHPHACIKNSPTRCWVSKRKSTFQASTRGPKDIHTQWRGKKKFVGWNFYFPFQSFVLFCSASWTFRQCCVVIVQLLAVEKFPVLTAAAA